MTRMNIFNLVYKLKKQNLRKTVWWSILNWHIFYLKRVFKPLPSCKGCQSKRPQSKTAPLSVKTAPSEKTIG